MRVSDEKIAMLSGLCETVADDGIMSLKSLQSILGKLFNVCHVLPQLRIILNRLIEPLSSQSKDVVITNEIRQDLKWLADVLYKMPYSSLMHPVVILCLSKVLCAIICPENHLAFSVRVYHRQHNERGWLSRSLQDFREIQDGRHISSI